MLDPDAAIDLINKDPISDAADWIAFGLYSWLKEENENKEDNPTKLLNSTASHLFPELAKLVKEASGL